MPIKVNLHDNTSHIKIEPKGNTSTPLSFGPNIDKNRFELLLNEEIQNRINGDEFLQNQIDSLSFNNVRYITIDENKDGSIIISLLNDKEELIDNKTITLTEKIVKSAELDYDNSRIIYTCNDDTTFDLDIADIVNHISNNLNKIQQLETNLSILDDRVTSTELELSTLINTTIPGINDEISVIQSDINNVELELSKHSDDIEGINAHLDLLDTDLAATIAELSIVDQKKIDKLLTNYPNINPSELTAEQVKTLLVYVSNNGIPNYAKLNELGFSKVVDIEDINKANSGDLLIDMH